MDNGYGCSWSLYYCFDAYYDLNVTTFESYGFPEARADAEFSEAEY